MLRGLPAVAQQKNLAAHLKAADKRKLERAVQALADNLKLPHSLIVVADEQVQD